MNRPTIYPGTHIVGHAAHLDRCMISLNRLETRKSDFEARDWILDSGAFTRIAAGRGHMPAEDYADRVNRWARCGRLVAAVTQDWMCEPFILSVTGETVEDHQHRTTHRYLGLRRLVSPYLMPVIQGWDPDDYHRHTLDLSPYLPARAWIGVGSVCKRQGRPDRIASVLEAVHDARRDLRLHGFGVKATALRSTRVRDRLSTVDSMAWSFAARYDRLHGHDVPDANSLQACRDWLTRTEQIQPDGVTQTALPLR